MPLSFDRGLAKLIHDARRSVRALFEDEGFVEVTYPSLDPATGVAYYSTFQVTAPGSNDFSTFQGTLLVSGGRYMAEAARVLGRSYRIGSSFRPDAGENNLAEFSSIHAACEGKLDDVLTLAERLVSLSIAAVIDLVPESRKALLSTISFPLPRIDYEDALDIVGAPPEHDLTYDESILLLNRLGVHGAFVIHIPESVSKYSVFHSLDKRGRPNNFDLILSYSAETLSGCEYELDNSVLLSRLSKSALLIGAAKFGVTVETYKPMIDLATGFSEPVSSLYCGHERLIRFLLGAGRIEAACLWPVNKRFLVP